MTGPAIEYHYSYPFESKIARAPRSQSSEPQLRLATFTAEEVHPYFFEGSLKQPYKVARMLQGLVQLVRTRFFVHPAMLPQDVADPIITAHEDFLRFEVFSGCCSVYARVDLPPPALDGRTVGRGTTNVDFNPRFVAALGKVRSTDHLDVSVGVDQIVLENDADVVVEKQVQLPLRWLKGLAAVALYGKRLQLRHVVAGPQAIRFLRSLPRTRDHKSRWWIHRSGASMRISQRPSKDAVQAGALNRLRVLEELASFATQLRVYGDDDVEASCWELDCGDCRFSIMMTHDVWRGFSGEGQGLHTLASSVPPEIVRKTRSTLTWQPVLDAGRLSSQLLDPRDLESGLAVLATQGQVGFDTFTGHYFHRELPFDLELVAKLAPRLRDAHKLLENRRVASVAGRPDVFEISSSDTIHTVRLLETDSTCTCPWHARHQGRRGPCKHILAAQILAAQDAPQAGP